MAKSRKPKISNFRAESSFFFYIIKYYQFINKKLNQNKLKPTLNELKILKDYIDKYNNTIKLKESINKKKIFLLNLIFIII